MNLKEIHKSGKELSVKLLFTATEGKVNSIQLQQNAELAEHVSRVPALLVCVSGMVEYEDERNTILALGKGDYVEIIPDVKHKLNAMKDSELILIK